MDLDLTSDQELLRETSARFIQSASPLTAVRELRGTATADYRRQAAELGWFALLVPEEHGGGNVSGNGVLDAAVVAEERGRFLQPTVFVPANAVARGLAIDGSPDQQAKVLPAIASGEATVTWACATADGGWRPEDGVVAEARGAGFVLNGRKSLVQDGDTSDWVLVTVGAPSGPAQFLVPAGTPGMGVHRLDSLDLTRTFSEVRFDNVELPASALVGRFGGAAVAVEEQLRVAVALTVAECVGAMGQDFEVTVDYAKARTAFGRPIGSFQAVKHLLADTSLLLEASKALSAAAARAVGSGAPDAGEVVSMAKAFVSDSAIDLAQNCFQVFGGIGHTWEHDQHLYLRRVTTDAALYGDSSWHRERVCQWHEL
ncbi:MAG TPA: acyl-CoA dehydrogenase family protein [Acidimicrobiales bacterium]|nr:acyl-CoA dehydrogenase family protein [Acidimicrobiales bacterium]